MTSYIRVTWSRTHARSNSYGAKLTALHTRSVFDLVSNMSTGREMLATLFPLSILLPYQKGIYIIHIHTHSLKQELQHLLLRIDLGLVDHPQLPLNHVPLELVHVEEVHSTRYGLLLVRSTGLRLGSCA
jgi:hypothetical protein